MALFNVGKTEHNGAKNGDKFFTREEAKLASKKLRRRRSKNVIEEETRDATGLDS